MRRFTLALILLTLASSASAELFSQIVLDGRSEALGGNATGIETDGASALANPARLPQLRQAGAHFLLHDWYGSGVRSSTVAWLQPYRGGGFSVAWHRYGLSDLWVEDEISLGAGWSFELAGRNLGLGLRLRGLVLDVPGYEGSDLLDSMRGFTFDASILLPYSRDLSFAFQAKSLAASEIEMLEGGETWSMARGESRLAGTYLWRKNLALIFEYRSIPGRDAELIFGSELRFFEAFHIRGGTTGRYATAGFGLRAARWNMDFAFQSRGRLGNTLTFSLSPIFGSKEVAE